MEASDIRRSSTAAAAALALVGWLPAGAVESRGVETMVLVRTADGWRIRHIHWSSR